MQARELISARIDGEVDEHDDAALTAHLVQCASCRAYENDAFALRRALRMRPAEETRPASSVDLVGSLRAISVMRWTLFVIGATLVILNASPVISPDVGTAAHLSRHDGIFGTALGIGMLAVAARPHRAMGLVPLTSAIAVLMAVAATADVVSGDANLLAESVHVVEFAGLVCLWIISGGPSRLPKYLAMVTRHVPAFAARRSHVI